MSTFIEGNFGLVIPKGLVCVPENWKVLGLLTASCTIYGSHDELFSIGFDNRDEIDRLLSRPQHQELREVALLLPTVPGTGGITTGFNMTMAMLEKEDELSTKKAVNLRHQGILGFVLDNILSIRVDELNDPYHSELNSESGLTRRVRSLKNAIDLYRELLTQVASSELQMSWREAAIAIAPYLASFFDYRPEWEILEEETNSLKSLGASRH